MTHDDIAYINKIHDRLEELEQQGRFLDADEYFARHHAAFNYDRKGNWIGSVSNENGWTA